MRMIWLLGIYRLTKTYMMGADVMANISLCMIVRDEHEVLARCLSSVCDAVDEIVIVDTGSQDDTRDIALRYTDKVYEFKWQDDFAAARNYAFDMAHGDYLMWLDADDVIAPEQCERLSRFKDELDARMPNAIMMKYCLAFDEDGRCTMWNWRERLLRREAGMRWQGAVHEVIAVIGSVEHADIAIEHRPGKKPLTMRNLLIYEGRRARGENFSARDIYYYARELYAHGLYAEAARRFEEFLMRGDGWIEDEHAAYRLLGACRAGMGDGEGELMAYLNALKLGAPRAGMCCALGRWYVERSLWPAAEFWFKAALDCGAAQDGFIDEDERAFLPYIWLCVCRDRQGDMSGARHYCKLAAAIKPHDPTVLRNMQYFERHASAE